MNWKPSTIKDAANILETEEVAYVRLDADFRYSLVNRAAEHLLGKTRADLLGKVLWDVYPEYIGTAFEANYRRAMAERVAVSFEGYSETWRRWRSIAATPDSDFGIVIRTVDITEKKQAEEAMRENELRYRTLADSGQALIWTSTPDKKCDYFNQPWLNFTGRTLDQELGDGWVEGLHPEDLKRCVEIYTRAFDRRERFSMDYRIRRRDGEFGWIQDDGTPRYDSNGTFLGYIGHGLDISQRKQSEAALQESETLLDEIGEIAKVGAWKIELGSKRLIWSREVRRIHEVDEGFIPTVEKAIGFYVPQSRTVMQQAVEYALERSEPFDMELEIVTAKNRRLWVHVIGKLKKQDGGMDVLSGTFQDINARRRAEKERDDLQLQLAQAQKMESVGRLAGGVAHDFNNLLTVINGYSQMLLGDLSPGDPLRDILGEIHKAGERAAALTRQLLAFSRKQLLEPRKLNVNLVIEEMRPMLERLVREDVEVRIVLSADGGTIYADPHQLEQVVMNLVVNARDAMPVGGKLLVETATVECDETCAKLHADAHVGRYVMLAVSDNGLGMSEETRRQIFEPFFTTKGAGKGTGLGLSMVHGIVAQSGGYVDVHSEEGRGTTVKIYFPVQAQETADEWRLAAVPVLGGRETVLVVEDQSEVRKYAVAVLKAKGYRVIPAENAGEALLICERERIDLVLTDVVMPNVSGRELATRLEKLRPGIKVLFMSGYTDNVIEQHGVLEEGAKYIQKPFNPEELAGKVREALGTPALAPRLVSS